MGGEVDMNESTNPNRKDEETTLLHLNKFAPDQSPMPTQADRSEERRVGKECA